jgi:uncharacterized SAM-binding protein YcdF (DUF218 family)
MSDLAKKRAVRKVRIRFLLYLILLIVAFLAGGFFVFAGAVAGQEEPDPVPIADGIVVWTGKGGGRLDAGAKLLAEGKGQRLLISGVNEKNSREDVLNLLGLDPKLGNCCVDLDYLAEDTIGNANETTSWAEAMGYDHIILVTSAYHMPRAKQEIAAANSYMRITPFPVAAERKRAWWRDAGQTKRLVQEYGKLLLTFVRHTGEGTRQEVPVLDEIPQRPEL